VTRLEQSGNRQQESGQESMDVSIICVNWNSLGVLRECISSIYETTKGIAFEIIVVDNASPEGGVDTLQAEFPAVRIIKSCKNLGFGGANNLGFEHSSGAHVLFLNPDTKLVNPAINLMLQQLQGMPDAGVVGCKLLNSDLSLQTSCIQQFPTIVNQLLDIDFLRRRWPKSRLWGIAPLFMDAREPVRVEVISGACMMLRREAFERAGKFSTEYFMYAEDLDLCYKVTQLGLYNYYVGEGTVIHHGQKSSSKQGGAKPIQWAIVMRSNSVMQFCTKTRGPAYGAIYRTAMAVTASCRLLILALMLPLARLGGNKDSFRVTSIKWWAVLEWAIGRYELTALPE